MSWFFLKKAKMIVYLSNAEYGKFVDLYAEMKHWSASDKLCLYIAGTGRNKKMKRVNDFIIDSMTDDWERDKKGFHERHSFAYHADNVEKNLYELIWSFCELNPKYQMLKIIAGGAVRPTCVDSNLSVTYGKDFYVGQQHRFGRTRTPESQYRITKDTIKLIYGNMMDFRIAFDNGIEYRFQTLLDGRKTSGSISIDAGDLSKWKNMIQKAEEERLAQEKANAPERIISTEELQKTSLVFAQDVCEMFYKETLEIEQSYERNAMIPNIFVDFSVYKQRWISLQKRSNMKCDEIMAFNALWRKQPDRDYSATYLYALLLTQTEMLCEDIYKYCDKMAQMMQHLYEKAQGCKYSKKEYLKELQSTEWYHNSIEEYYTDVKKRYQDLIDGR